MPNFIADDIDLDFPKEDRRAKPPGEEASKFISAADWNKLCQAVEDLKGYVRASVNVKAYGAVGDGTTDDTAAIQRAVDSATNLDLLIPSGMTCLVSAPITKTSGSLSIHGLGATIRLAASFPAQDDQAGVIDARNMDEIEVSDLTLDGNSTALNGGAGFPDWQNFIEMVLAWNVSSVRLLGCTLTNFPSIGLQARGCERVLFEGNKVSDGMFHGIYAEDCTNVTAVRNIVVGRGDMGSVAGIGGLGVHFTDCDYVDASRNHISNISDTGLKGQGCSYVTCERNTVETCGKDGIKWMGTANFPAPSFARVANNAVSVINAWRTDGSSLILIADYQGAYVGGNQVRGGGTRVSDAIRCNLQFGTEQRRYIVEGNLGESIDGYGVNADTITGLTLRGNHFDGPISIQNPAGEVLIEGGSVTSGGTIDSSRHGIAVTNIRSGSVVVRGVAVSEHLTGVAMFAKAGATIDVLSAVDNVIKTCHQYGIRVDNSGASNADIRLVELRGNTLRDTVAGASSSACIRIATDNLTIAIARVTHNTVQNLTANTISNWLELTGSATDKIALLDITGLQFVGVTNTWTITNQTRASRILGWRANAVPTFGTWVRGDIVLRQSPAAAGEWGYVCTADGSPGTWKNLTAIAS